MSSEVGEIPEDPCLLDECSFRRVKYLLPGVFQHRSLLKSVELHYKRNSVILQDARNKMDQLNIQKYQHSTSDFCNTTQIESHLTDPNNEMDRSVDRLKSREPTRGLKKPRPNEQFLYGEFDLMKSPDNERSHPVRHVLLKNSKTNIKSIEERSRQNQAQSTVSGSNMMFLGAISNIGPIASIAKVTVLATLINLSVHYQDEFISTGAKGQTHKDCATSKPDEFFKNKSERIKFYRPDNLSMCGKHRKRIGSHFGGICYKPDGHTQMSHSGRENVRIETPSIQSLTLKFLPYYIRERLQYPERGLQRWLLDSSTSKPNSAHKDEHVSVRTKSGFLTKRNNHEISSEAQGATRNTGDISPMGGSGGMTDMRTSNLVHNSLSLYHKNETIRSELDNEANNRGEYRRIESEISETEIEYIQPLNFVNTVEETEENLIYENVDSALEDEDSFTYKRNELGTQNDRSENEEDIDGEDSENARLFY